MQCVPNAARARHYCRSMWLSVIVLQQVYTRLGGYRFVKLASVFSCTQLAPRMPTTYFRPPARMQPLVAGSDVVL